MSLSPCSRIRCFLIAVFVASFLIPAGVSAGPPAAVPAGAGMVCRVGASVVAFGMREDEPTKKKKKKKRKKKRKSKKKSKNVIRWGQRRNESDKKYDKRYARLLKRVKQDKKGDYSGGRFVGSEGEVRLWTYMGHPFIVRSDIDAKFTADTTMYMEMLHREYGATYKKILGIKADVKEKIEVIVFSDQSTYMANGGTPGSGGFFNPAAHMSNDRGAFWPARHYRLQQFTDGITDFAKWPKGTLKHEAAHMELQLRLGYTLFRGARIGYPVDCPRWLNEGHASVFEYWDFDKTVEKNLAEIPNRGRYAPIVRRAFGTDKWKDFDYVWDIDPQTWHKDMTSRQGYLNYCQAWSLAAYMMNGGKKGNRDFRRIFDLSKRVGVDRKSVGPDSVVSGLRAWDDAFPESDRQKIAKHWTAWIEDHLPKNESIPDEEWYVKLQGYKPEVTDKLEPYSKKEFEALREEIKKEEERRRKEREIEK